MKQLLLMRHAKSSWEDSTLADHERPLNSRGERDACRMGRLLKKLKLVPDQVVSSTAVRAARTAQLVAQGCCYGGSIEFVGELYHASPAEWEQILRRLPPDSGRVLAIGHNPGMEEFLLRLCGRPEKLPTAAIACLRVDTDDWGQLGAVPVELQNVWRPKELD